MMQRAYRNWCVILALSIWIGHASTAQSTDSVASDPPVPPALQTAMTTVWKVLEPYIERSHATGYDGMLFGADWFIPIYNWKKRGIEKRRSAKKFLLPLRTVIEHASCHGHPEALRSLYRLRSRVAIPFLTLEHRLLLEWRALHMGENLRFFEPVRSRTTLRRASLGQTKPAPPKGEIQSAHPRKWSSVVDTPFPSFIDDEFILNKLAKLLKNRQFDEAIRQIPELAELCLGIARPLDKPILRYDPVVLPKTAG